MKLFLATQRYIERGGPRLGTDTVIGIVIAEDEASALAFIPNEAVCHWEGMQEVVLKACGEVDGKRQFFVSPLWSGCS